MKRINMLACGALLFLALGGAVACGGDDDDNNAGDTPEPGAVATETAIAVGTIEAGGTPPPPSTDNTPIQQRPTFDLPSPGARETEETIDEATDEAEEANEDATEEAVEATRDAAQPDETPGQ
jgi:hypothetical protein